MVNTTERSLEPFHHRPTFAEINVTALKANLSTVRARVAPAKVLAVVKANAYGHGLVPAAQAFDEGGADYFGVAHIEEALELRRAGICKPILVFGGLLKDQLHLYIQNDINVTASSVSKLEQIDATAAHLGRRAKVHLKIDTGLERIGVHYYSANALFDAAMRAKNTDVAGVYSHFADADSSDQSFTRLQLERFHECLRYYETRASLPFIRHIAGSGALLAVPESHLDMVRPGVILYGVLPAPCFEGSIALIPALSLKSQVVFFKVVKKGAGVSYSHRWTAPEDSRVVTVPIGYGDGYYRAFTNRASVLIRGKRYPVVGTVCMDQIMVNIGDGTAYNGDEVILIGKQGDERITIEDMSKTIDGNPREIMVLLNQRVPRLYTAGA